MEINQLSDLSGKLSVEALTIFLWAPLVLAGLSAVLPKGIQRSFAVVASFFLAAMTIFESCQGHGEGTLPWLGALGIDLSFRLDPVSKWFVIGTSIVAVIASSLRGSWYIRSPRLFVSSLFFLVAALNTAFLSTNVIAFYIGYEAVFVPMIFMVGIWGTKAKASSVLRFFLMSFLGSILMLVSMFFLLNLYHQKTGQYSAQIFDLVQVARTHAPESLHWTFWGFFLAFAIKVPLFPFHGWLKEVYVNAPMPATILMSAVLSKLGVFGFIRFVLPLFPDQVQQYQGFLIGAATLSVIYPALLAIQSTSSKSLLAYSSMSHLGFVMLGVFSLRAGGIGAAVLLSLGHTLVSALLFLVTHYIGERQWVDRMGDLDLNQHFGLAKKFPILFTVFFFGVLASVSLPGTVNFVGEFLVLNFAYPVSVLGSVVSGLGVILGAVYMLKLFQRLGLGPVTASGTTAADLGLLEILFTVVLIGLIIYLGFQPQVVLRGF